MHAITSKSELEARLRRVSLRLALRQIARALFSGLAWSALTLVTAVFVLDLLPRLLLERTAGVPVLVLAAVAGFTVGTLIPLRRFRMPGLAESALALQARLDNDSSALAAALQVDHESGFLGPVLRAAGEECSRAEAARPPELIPTMRLVTVPLVVLVAVLTFLWALALDTPVESAVSRDHATTSSWAPVDIGGGRSERDQAAIRQALGLKEAAATLNRSAATLRSAESSAAERQAAIEDARAAMNSDAARDAAPDGVSTPVELTEDPVELEALAEALLDIAAGFSAKAAAIDGDSEATEDSGRNGSFAGASAVGELVPFPEPQDVRFGNNESLPVQSTGRRNLAVRALSALDRIRSE